MKTTTLILLAASLMLIAAAGCDTGSRRQSAAARWEQTMEQVRLEAARESLAQGQYAYARKALEPCMRSDRTQREAETLMAQIQAADQMYAQLSSYRQDQQQERAY